MSRYRFVLRPRWILSHALIVLLVVVMVNLGFWQLRRLHEKQAANRAVKANTALPESSIDSLLQPGNDFDAGSLDAFRRVTATGTYDLANEAIVRARTLNGQPGVWVLTPLRLSDGSALVVNRGFLPTAGTPHAVPPVAEPPGGALPPPGPRPATPHGGAVRRPRPPSPRRRSRRAAPSPSTACSRRPRRGARSAPPIRPTGTSSTWPAPTWHASPSRPGTRCSPRTCS